MKTATFIEKHRGDQKISHTIKKSIPWQSSFDSLKEGDVFEAEFVSGGLTMDFRIVQIIGAHDIFGLSDDAVTFWIEKVEKLVKPI